ncbi:MAG TPA: histidine phosphatase family protein [Streptosporangiaceae bacterium]|nr:histidine phosphatase family protein [Streptosporangiaceae bacterium]
MNAATGPVGAGSRADGGVGSDPDPGSAADAGPAEVSLAAASTTIVHLVRHGEVANQRGVLYGRIAGFHLSEDGQVMAKAAADFMAGRDVTVLRSSPLERAVETAEPIAAQLGLAIEVDERLIEPWNHFEGLNVGVGDGSLRAPRHWIYLRNPFRPSWGEPYRQVAERVLAATADAARAARGHEAVCVSHQLPIWVSRRSAEGRRLWHDPRRRQCALGSVTSLTYTGERLTSVSYAEPSGSAGSRVAGA